MVLNVVDAFIIIFLILGGIVGFKNGAIKEGTKFVGLFIIIVISFLLKDRIMVLLYENLPFFNFFGMLKGISAVSILLYQLISFIFIFLVLFFFLRILIVITGLIEWLLKFTIFLSIPSKIVGIFVGIIEYYIYIFIILYVLNMPLLNLDYINEAKIGKTILNNTPILSGMVDDTVEVYTDVWNIIQNKENKTTKEINTLVLATLLDNKLITVESAKKLVLTNKVSIEDESILDNYESDGDLYDKLKQKYHSKLEQETKKENEKND